MIHSENLDADSYQAISLCSRPKILHHSKRTLRGAHSCSVTHPETLHNKWLDSQAPIPVKAWMGRELCNP
jgi:hypothetical protein